MSIVAYNKIAGWPQLPQFELGQDRETIPREALPENLYCGVML